MRKRPTLKDIARATGVHPSTVSRALDASSRSSLSEEVVERVREAARTLGYRPNRVAFSLRKQKTMTVGVMIPDITNMIFPPIVRGIESVMEAAGYASILVNTDSQPRREERLLEILQERGVDGIIHTAVLRSDPGIVEAARQGLPVVTLNRRIEETNIPYVINDEEEGIRLVFELLRRQGHRRIAHLAGPAELSTGRLRLKAFQAMVDEAGLGPNDTMITEAERFDEEEGRRCAAEIHARAPGTTAVLCANDRLALGAMSFFQSIGRSCPKDISITGFNDMPLLELIPPGLTTVRIQQFEAGAIAARLLLSLIERPDERVPQATILPVGLVERGSVAPPSLA
ncbi:LacI family DNA-binding transcriptional regulator [Stappia sp. WLB 29]|uniref:LacI family DNA-binding transcriptional regulator n=1 Tax=Stappia sp. WLB 29 TaxID=2925220 RepID=UPI0020BFBFE8|nr:LacI family DNA-binding transcriptional regulator [Stappia sp. WLB 29]